MWPTASEESQQPARPNGRHDCFARWSSRKRLAWSCSQSGAALFGSAERALGRGVAAVLGAGEGYLVLVEL